MATIRKLKMSYNKLLKILIDKKKSDLRKRVINRSSSLA